MSAKVSTSAQSKALAKDLGERPEGGWQAAHIVPSNNFTNRSAAVQRAIKKAQKKMDKYLKGKRNTHINGFWGLPGHAGTHTNKFFLELGEAFANVGSSAQARGALRSMWNKIKKGTYG